jgi:transcriptional regulator with XRE-family HTH domain
MVQTFGSFVRALRQRRGITALALANHMRWSQPYVSQIESGGTKPPPPVKVQAMIDFIEASEHAAELEMLAAVGRGAVVLRLGPETDPNVATMLSRLARVYNDGGLTPDAARSMWRALDKFTAA